MSMRNQSLDFVTLVSFLVCMPRRMKILNVPYIYNSAIYSVENVSFL